MVPHALAAAPPALLLALAVLSVLPPDVHAPLTCSDRLGAECSAFSTMGECRGRRREWMHKNCALSCGACRPVRPTPAPDAPKVARRSDNDDAWKMHVVELNDAPMLARFHRSNKQSMVRCIPCCPSRCPALL